MSECSICGLEMQCCRTVAMKDLIEQRDQANRTCSDALSRAERAETDAGDLRANLKGMTEDRDAFYAKFFEEQRAHAETRAKLKKSEFDRRELASHWQSEIEAHAKTLAALEQANQNFVNQHRDAVVHLMNELDETREMLGAKQATIEDQQRQLAAEVSAHNVTRAALQRAEERSSLNFREFERASKELAETRAKLEECQAELILTQQDLGSREKTPAEQAVLDAMAKVPAETLKLELHFIMSTTLLDAMRTELARREAAK